MSEFRKIAESLRHCAVGIGHCRECLAYGENRCSELLKRTAADAIEQLLKERAGTSPAPTERTDGGKAQELPWKKLHVGQVVWFLWRDDDANAWEIGQEVATAVGYEGFWYSGDLNNPLSADAFVPWDRIGVDAFLTQQAARERMEAANE